MDETPLRVDPARLHDLAGRVDRSAHALSAFQIPDLDPAELAGSAVSAAVRRARVSERLDAVARAMTNWAGAARASATAFGDAEQENARRLGES